MFKRVLLTSAVLCAFSVAAEEKKAFTMDGEFGLNTTSGNTETTTITGSLTAKQNLDKWENEYILQALYAENTTENEAGVETDEVTAEQYFASAQGNYKLSNPDHRLFLFSSYEEDKLGAFEYQATVAAGWNQKVWDDEKSAFEYSIGPGYSFQETQTPDENGDTDADTFVVRASLAYRWTISDTSKFTQTLSTEVGSTNTKSRSETALSAQIGGGLSLKLALRLDHNSDVADDIENLDTETAVTLVYSFF